MAKFDKSKPHGEVVGHSVWRYEQDGKFFNGAGNECDEKGKLIGAKSPAPTPAPVTPPDNVSGEITPDTEGTEGAKEPAGTKGTEGTEEPEESKALTMNHRGGGYYEVFDANGELVGDDFKKAAAEEKLTALKEAAEQINQALSGE